jgi:predicted phage terminase large subunit-like protein
MAREVEVRLPAPLPHQVEILRDPARFKVVCCGRRWGKTICGLLAALEGHGPREGGMKGALEGATIWWIAPTFAVASAVWRDLKSATRGAWSEKNENERRLAFFGGGSVTVKSADAPDSLRGVGLDGVVLDEAAHFSTATAWTECLRPALADRQGWAIFISTPKGQNWFFDLFQQAETAPNTSRWQRPTSDNPRVPAGELTAARAELGSYVYGQEFDALFLVAGGGHMKPEYLRFYVEPIPGAYVLAEHENFDLERLSPRWGVVDLATSTKTAADKTCALGCGISPRGRMVVMDALWDRIPAPELIPKLDAFVAQWQLDCLYVESVGYQLAMVQMLRDAGLAIREFKPGTRDKTNRFMVAVAHAEGGKVWLPRSARWTNDAVSELTAFPNGLHDDFCDALSMAVLTYNESVGCSPPQAPPRSGKSVLDLWPKGLETRAVPEGFGGSGSIRKNFPG